MKHAILLICIFAACIALPVHADTDEESGPGVPPTALVQTAPVSARNVAETLPVFGTLEPSPRASLTLAAPRDSVIATVAVSGGERVHKGQVLLTLAPTPQSRATWVQAKSAADYARGALSRTHALYKEHLATRDQVAAAEKALRDAQANLTEARAAGGGGELALRAPADGAVTGIGVGRGEHVTANTALLTLVIRGGLQARLGVAPERTAGLRAGLPVNLASVFDPKANIKGRIAAVGGALDPATGLVDVFVPLPRAVGFLPGGQVQGAITLSDNRGLAVPRAAVLRDAQGAYVFVVREQVAHRVNVKIGADDGEWIAVSGDLKAGEPVVVLGNYELTDGMRVREQTP